MRNVKKYILEFSEIIKNFSYTLCYQILAFIMPLITIPYVTRVLNQDFIGVNSVWQANCSYLEVVASLGISLLGPREIAKCLGDKEKISKTFYSLYKIQFIMHITVLIAYISYLISFSKNIIGYIYLLYFISNTFDISWLFIGLEDFKSITIRNVFIRTVGIFLLFGFVKSNNDRYLYVAFLYLPQLIMNIYMWYTALKKYFVRVNLVDVRLRYFKESVSLFLPQIASNIYSILDKNILGMFSTYAITAVYAQGQMLLQLFYAVVPSFCRIMAPRLSGCIEKKDNKNIYKYMRMSCHVICAISVLLFWGVLACAKIFVGWYLPAEYTQTAEVLMFCSPIIIFVGGSNLISIEFLIPLGEQSKYTKAVIAAAITNLILNFLLISFMGLYGVCIASVMAEAVSLAIQLYYAKKYLNLKKIFEGTFVYVIAGAMMYLALRIVVKYVSSTFIGLFECITIGILLYIIFIWFIQKIKNIL